MTKKEIEENVLPATDFPFQLIAATCAVADARTPTFERKNYEVCTFEYILRGSGCLKIDGQTFYPKKDGIYMLAKGRDHAYWPNRSDPWHKAFFVIDGSLMSQLIDAYKMTRIYYVPNCAPLKHFFEEMIQLNPNSAMVNQQSVVIFHQFISELARYRYGMPDILSPEVEKLKEMLDASMTGNFNLSDYAAKSNYSEAHLIRIFRTAFDMTPYDYLMSKKIELAKRLLLYSSFSIKEIAAHLAFSDQYYFSNYFKTKCGISPRNYKSKYIGIRRSWPALP